MDEITNTKGALLILCSHRTQCLQCFVHRNDQISTLGYSVHGCIFSTNATSENVAHIWKCCSHLFTLALSFGRPRMTSCKLHWQAERWVVAKIIDSAKGAASWGSGVTNEDRNGNTKVVMLLIFGHARSAPSASVKSGTSNTTNTAAKRYYMVWWRVPWHLTGISLTDCSI